MSEHNPGEEHTTIIPRSESIADEADSLDELSFENWERYQVLDFLGAGATSKVYKAIDPTLNRKVALKFIWGKIRQPKNVAFSGSDPAIISEVESINGNTIGLVLDSTVSVIKIYFFSCAPPLFCSSAFLGGGQPAFKFW